MKPTLAWLFLLLLVALKTRSGVRPLLSFVSYDGYRTTEALVSNASTHDVRIRIFGRYGPAPQTSIIVGAGRSIPLRTEHRYDFEPPIDSPELFFRYRDVDSFELVFDGKHRVIHYPHVLPAGPSGRHLGPASARNIGWIGSWEYRAYRDPYNSRLIDGFRYQITESDYQYASR